MAKIKLTKSVVDAAQAQVQPIELRATLVPGFLCKITPDKLQGVHAPVPHERRRAA